MARQWKYENIFLYIYQFDYLQTQECWNDYNFQEMWLVYGSNCFTNSTHDIMLGHGFKDCKPHVYSPQLIFHIKECFNWLIIFFFTSRSKRFHLSGDVTIAGEGLQNLGLYSAVSGAFEQGGIFIVPHLLWHLGFSGLIRRPPHSVAFYDTQGGVRNIF
jgi:hypothetical protein